MHEIMIARWAIFVSILIIVDREWNESIGEITEPFG